MHEVYYIVDYTADKRVVHEQVLFILDRVVLLRQSIRRYWYDWVFVLYRSADPSASSCEGLHIEVCIGAASGSEIRKIRRQWRTLAFSVRQSTPLRLFLFVTSALEEPRLYM